MAATLCAGALAACSMMGDETPAPTSGTIEENTVEVTAKVKDVDQSTRMVTLLTSTGEVVTFHAGPEIKNLAQLEAGDVVRAQYYESVVYEVKKPGESTHPWDLYKIVQQIPGDQAFLPLAQSRCPLVKKS